MRRILLVLSVAALMAVMMVATAMPAFAGGGGAKDGCDRFGLNNECKGGTGGGGGGAGGGTGGQRSFESNGDLFFSGGGGGGGRDAETRGGAGGHCTGSINDLEPEDCHGKNFSGANNQ
jgi:hypothetical protein